MRLPQDKDTILHDIYRYTAELESNISAIESTEYAKYSYAAKEFRKLQQQNFDPTTASYRELQSYRRQLYEIYDMRTSNLEDLKAYVKTFGKVYDKLDEHSTKWGRNVTKAFERAVELVNVFATEQFRYVVQEAITQSKASKARTEEMAIRLKTAYDKALAEVGNDNEQELIRAFLSNVTDLSKRGAVPRVDNPPKQTSAKGKGGKAT